jgi:hypothetical protein
MFLSLILFAADDMSANPSVDEAPVTHEAHVGESEERAEPTQTVESEPKHHHHHEMTPKSTAHKVHHVRRKMHHHHAGKKSAYGTDQCTKELNRHAIPHHHHHHHNGDSKK